MAEKSQKCVYLPCQKSQKCANSMMMKRKIYDQLLDWKRNRRSEVALLIEGAK